MADTGTCPDVGAPTGDDAPGSFGAPEPLDMNAHPRATLIGIVLLGALFLFASFALGRSISKSEQRATVERVTLPRLENRPVADAQRNLESLGLLVAVEYQSNELLPAGEVFAQKPIAGAKVEPGGEVTLVVSDGPGGTPVPSITGESVAQAQGLLTALGLTPEVRQVSDETVRPGEVIGSSPGAGTKVAPGSAVAILVSTGPAPRTVPAVVDQSAAFGGAEIARAGLGLGATRATYVAGKEAGLVVSTNPAPGTKVPRGSLVDVVVSAPRDPSTAPPLTGLLQATATSVATEYGYSLSPRSQQVPYGDSRGGRVVSQDVPPGTSVPSGTRLGVVIAVAAPPPTTTTTTTVAPAPPATPPATAPGG